MTRGDSTNQDDKRSPPTIHKHDILYSRARHVHNQRHIKRPWFNLNPFLEKTDEFIDLEEFVPDEGKYTQKLESLVLCESFSCDYPLDTRQLTIGKFFPYLYSDIWKDGISVRILEGQLFDQLLVSLYKLTKKGSVVQHKTYAFARNQRQITGCYKLADTKALGHIDEQLLIEFTYFGDLEKPQPNLTTTDPLDYLKKYRMWPEIHTSASDFKLPPIDESQMKKSKAASLIESASSKQKILQGLSTSTDKKRGSLFSKPLIAIRTLHAMRPSTKSDKRTSIPSSSEVLGTKALYPAQPPPIVDRRKLSELAWSEPSQRRQRTTDILEFEIPPDLQKLMDEARETNTTDVQGKAKIDTSKSKTVCKGKNHVEHSKTLTTEECPHYGDELYLSDANLIDVKKPQKAEKILQKKKMELQKRRQEKKDLVETIAEKKREMEERSKLKPLSDFEEKQKSYFLKMPENVPSLEEFIRLMREEEYVDPRFRNKERRKTRSLVKKYNLRRHTFRSKMKTDEVKSSSSQRLTSTSSRHVDDSLRKASTIGSGSRGIVRLPPLREHEVSAKNPKNFAEEVHGVTSSVPCKEHCLRVLSSYDSEKQAKEKREREREKFKEKLGPKDSTNRGSIKESASYFDKVGHTSMTTSSLFPRVSYSDEIMAVESPDSSSEEESDDDTSCFDSTKLKLNYSIERLRKKRRRSRRKPAFFEVLKKYYRAQAVLNAFRKNSLGQDEPAKDNNKTRKFSIRKYLKKAKAKEDTPPPTPPMVIGKLKKFKFLNVKSQKPDPDECSTADFSTPDLEDFENQLEMSLKDFVVRREIVSSVFATRCPTSITFTRKQSFKVKN